jgi:arsenate reductase (thioredoxin)
MEDVVFVCQHGGAKSLIAAETFSRIAAERGLGWRGVSAGLDPYDRVPEPVVAGLAAQGIDVSGFTPQPVRPDTLAAAAVVVHFGCDVAPLVPYGVSLEDWGDVPAVSEDFDRAHEAIVQRVEQLVDGIANRRSASR